jgi:predicted Zn-dependent protease
VTGYIGEKAMQALKNYDQSEVYVSDTVVNTVYIDNSEISNVETKHDVGMMFRMTKGGKSGKASVTLSGPDAESECISMADSVLKFSPVEEDKQSRSGQKLGTRKTAEGGTHHPN